jgi:hypothetical protein
MFGPSQKSRGQTVCGSGGLADSRAEIVRPNGERFAIVKVK